MTKALEQNQWYKGKAPVVREYLRTTKQIEDTVAQHGFLSTWLPRVRIRKPVCTKVQIERYNYQIVSDAIERELKNTGIAYDLAVKNAAIAWELEKTTVLSALERVCQQQTSKRMAAVSA